MDTSTGLCVQRQAGGWAVIHEPSGLAAAYGLRQKRFADDAMKDFIATGVDFTGSSAEINAVRRTWAAVYYKWQDRSRQERIDPETFEYYPHHTRCGSVIPSADLAARCRSLSASGRHEEAMKAIRDLVMPRRVKREAYT